MKNYIMFYINAQSRNVTQKEHLVVVVGDGIHHGDSILDGVQNDQEPLLCGILVVVKFCGVSERNGKEDVDGNIEQFPLKLCSSEGRDSQEGMEEIDAGVKKCP